MEADSTAAPCVRPSSFATSILLWRQWQLWQHHLQADKSHLERTCPVSPSGHLHWKIIKGEVYFEKFSWVENCCDSMTFIPSLQLRFCQPCNRLLWTKQKVLQNSSDIFPPRQFTCKFWWLFWVVVSSKSRRGAVSLVLVLLMFFFYLFKRS